MWCARLQTAVDALAERFHSVYGPAQQIHVLGGNASRCHGRVLAARYLTPDSVHDIRLQVGCRGHAAARGVPSPSPSPSP